MNKLLYTLFTKWNINFKVDLKFRYTFDVKVQGTARIFHKRNIASS